MTPAHAAPSLRLTACYVQNPTSGSLNFAYKAGGNDWQKFTVKPRDAGAAEAMMQAPLMAHVW